MKNFLKILIKIILLLLIIFVIFIVINYGHYKIQNKNQAKEINLNTYSIDVYYSPLGFPLFFAIHTWVVINSPEYGTERIEIHSIRNKYTNNFLYTNRKAPGEGTSLFAVPGLWYGKAKYKAILIYHEDGDTTKENVLLIHSSVNKYPSINKYVLTPGPNSNTFMAWVVKNFLNDRNIKLPFNAFGRNFVN